MSLLEREIKQLSSSLPQTSSIMSSAIAKLLLASPNPRANRNDPNSVFASFPHLSPNEWSDTGVFGALLLVVDRASDAVLIQIYDLDAMLKRFEFEIYYDMEYMSLDPSFHAFEMEECIAGLSFSNREVARKFLAKVRALTPDSSSRGKNIATPDLKKKGLFGMTSKQKPMEVSDVVNVVHHQHVGLNGDGTMDLNTVSPEWRAILKQAGVKKRDLKDPGTARALIQSIQQSGFSLAVAPGTYVQASPLKPKEGPLAERKPYPNAGPGMSQQPHHVYTAQELKKHYTKDQVDMYVSYQQQLAEYEKAQKKYLEELAEYEKQIKLQRWEKDNKAFLQQQDSKPKQGAPPPLPPRKKKTDGTPGDSLTSVPGPSAPRPGNSVFNNNDNRPRFETAPQQSVQKQYNVPPVITHSLPNPPLRKVPPPSPMTNYTPNNFYDENEAIPPRPMSPILPQASNCSQHHFRSWSFSGFELNVL